MAGCHTEALSDCDQSAGFGCESLIWQCDGCYYVFTSQMTSSLLEAAHFAVQLVHFMSKMLMQRILTA